MLKQLLITYVIYKQTQTGLPEYLSYIESLVYKMISKDKKGDLISVKIIYIVSTSHYYTTVPENTRRRSRVCSYGTEYG